MTININLFNVSDFCKNKTNEEIELALNSDILCFNIESEAELYRIQAAAKKLEKFREISGGTEQNPVLADCYRALEWWVDVEELWDELRDASPSGSLVTEGRIVAAGALADQGKVSGAINLLERGWRFPKRAKDYHLRRAYALADLYERSGKIPKARDLFVWITHQDKNYGDVASRIQALQ